MALTFWEGLDSYNNYGEFFNSFSRPNVTITLETTAATISSGTGRYSKNSLLTNSSGHTHGYLNFSTPITDMWIGKAFYIPSGAAFPGTGAILNAFNITNLGNVTFDADCMIQVKANGAIYVYRSGRYQFNNLASLSGGFNFGANLGNTEAGVFPFAAWNWIETRYKQSTSNVSTNGIVEVWVNNKQVLNLTNVINKPTNTYSTITSAVLAGHAAATLYVDDIYILDTSGPAPWNNRFGDCRIASVAVTGDATPNDFAVSSGNNSNHWTVVDEIPYSAADWLTIEASSANSGEMFSHATLPSPTPNSILAVAIVAVGGKTDAGNATFKMSIRTGDAGSNTYNSNTQFLSTTNTFYRQEWSANPNTNSQWTVSDWTNANVGVYVV